MKILSTIFCLMLVVCNAYGADVGNCTETLTQSSVANTSVVRLDCTAAAGDIVRTITSSGAIQGWKLRQVNVYPIVAPTAASDLYIYYGETLAKAGDTDYENIVTTTATSTLPSTGFPVVWGDWRIDVDNNVVAAARVVIEMFFSK